GIQIQRVLVGSSRRKFEKKRAVHRYSGARELFDSGVEIREQPVTLFDIPAANGFLLGSVNPHFLVSGAFVGVIAIDGLKGGEFGPTGQQLCAGSSNKTADIGAADAEAA